MNAPRVSILMAARDAGVFFAPALDSIQAQDFSDWELILIDDASQDGTRAAAQARAAGDARIRLTENDRSIGLAASLNRGLALARAPLLARMDADDLMTQDRLSSQVAAFEADPALGLLGANAQRIDAGGAALQTTDLPREDADIRARALFENPFVHPSVMMRASALRAAGAAYDESFDTTQDWALWAALLPATKAANLEAPLLRHRQHDRATSATRRDRQLANSVRAQCAYARALFGQEGWRKADLSAVTQAFVCGRAEADAAEAEGRGPGRVTASRAALRLLALFRRRTSAPVAAAAARYVVERAAKMGLAPPIKPGWAALAAQIAVSAPGEAARAASRLAFARRA